MSVFSGVRDRDMIIPWEIEEIRIKHIQILRKKILKNFIWLNSEKAQSQVLGVLEQKKQYEMEFVEMEYFFLIFLLFFYFSNIFANVFLFALPKGEEMCLRDRLTTPFRLNTCSYLCLGICYPCNLLQWKQPYWSPTL